MSKIDCMCQKYIITLTTKLKIIGLVKEFKAFLNQGNVLDLDVDVILAGAFQKIVDSLVNNIIMPIIALVADLGDIKELKEGPFAYGELIAAVLYFLIVGFILFIIIKSVNHTKK